MPKTHSRLKIKDDYFIVLGKKDENEEVQEGYLNELECPERHRQLFFWPDDLLSIAVSDEQMTSAQVEILEVLCSRPQKIEKLLEPNEKQLDKWNKRRTEDVSALAIRAQKRVNGFRYTKGDDASSPMLLIRIDDVIDQSKKIRKKIESLLRAKECRDTGPVEEDEGVLPDEYKRTEVTEKPTERVYYPSQIFLANQIVERIDVIYDHYHNGKSFENFDFYIYTANMNMLEDQTCSRLSKKESECFPESLYEGSDIKARKKAKEKVFKYQQKTVDEQFREMCSRVEKEPNTLFLIVADEAHWGATEGDKANSTLTNNWNAKDHPNVVLLQVTATPYNLLTENTRLPTAYYKCQDNSTYKVIKEDDIDRNTKLHNFKLLHQVKWTDNFKSKYKKGIIVKLRVPLPGKDKSPAQLYTKPPEKEDDFLPWYGLMLTKTYPNYTSEFLMQGNENDITISTRDGKWILVVRDNQVGFICRPTSHSYGGLAEDISSFSILDGYGEGLFLLKVKGNDGRERHLVYSDASQMIQLGSARGAPVVANDEDLPSLNASFLIEQCRSKESLGPEKEYISLIYYFNSMRNEEPKDQLIRDDLYFDKLVTHITKNKMTQKLDADDILIAEYSYYIILINLQRTCPLKLTSISQCYENLEECARDYLKKREEYKNEFITELGKQRSEKNISPIKPTAFEESLRLLSEKVKEDFRKDLNKFRTSPRPDAEEFIKSIVACLLHLNVEDLKDVENKLNDINVKTKLIQIYGNSQDLEIETKRKEILLDSETGRIVDTLIPCDLKKMSGTMGIIRTSTIESGNKMYKTLCIARQISSEVDYSFEIVRDYGKTRLCDGFDDDKLDQDRHERSARYRIRERMQPKKCTYTDPKTSASCSCAFRSDEIIPLSEPTMRCRKCSHVHKRIENYEDLDGLPCILILVDKGRLGNTFPQSLRVLDSRLCHTKTMGPVYFSSLVQELGRLSRHQIKSDEKPLPYTLISKHLADILRDGLHEGAPFNSLLHLPNKSRVSIDRKVDLKKGKVIPGPHAKRKVYVAKKGHFDHGNKSRNCNRILLRAEPQIGKTGVYLKVISILRKKYSSDLSDDSEVDDEDCDDQAEDTEDLSLESNKSAWVYPFWKYNKHGNKLDTNIKNGKYYPIYGGYTYGNPAPEILPQSISKKKKKKEKKMPSKELEIKSFSFREHSSCLECCVQHENDVLELSLPGNSSDSGGTINFRISVPKTRQYHVLLKYIEPFTASTLQYPIDNLDNLSDDSQCLNSWIFIPSHKRHERANVNLYHTMVTEKSGESLPRQYTTILVVRRTDFESYCKLWQSTHAILQIPETLPRADRDAEEGGIGFARLSIQIFAEKLGLNWIFMLDDNMPYVREIEESESLVKRKNGNLIETKVPLFKVLKHIEMQVDGSVRRAPIEGFEKYTEKHPEITIKHPLEEYTGVNNNYGIIGVKKHRPTSGKVKRPFIKTHVHSLLFLNINTLKDKNVYYKPWQVFEDLTINNDCDTKGLWVCKYNRFTVLKQHLKTWIPDVYTWNEDTKLSKSTEVAQNSTDILISYLRCIFTIKDVIELADNKEEDTDFEHLLRGVPKETGKHKLMVIRNRDFKESTMRLQDIVKDPSFFTEGQNYFIIMISSDLCIEEGLTKKKLIEEWLKKTLPVPVHRNLRFEVITSHNVGCFQVKILLVIVKVTIPYSSATSKKNQATSETFSKKRTSDAKEGRAKKLQKYDDDGAVEQNQPGTSLKDEIKQLREENATLKQTEKQKDEKVATLEKQVKQMMAFIKKKNRNVNETDEENTSDGEFDV